MIGPHTFREEQAPAYTGGSVAMMVCYLVAAACISAYGLLCKYDNKKRRAEIDSMAAAESDWLDLTDKENKGFKYTT